MATTKFSDVDDFLAELRLDAAAGEVDRLILRLVSRWERGDPSAFTRLSVVASYTTGGDPVRLENHCGTFLSGLGEEQDVRKLAAERRDKIEAAARECGLQLRGGVFE